MYTFEAITICAQTIIIENLHYHNRLQNRHRQMHKYLLELSSIFILRKTILVTMKKTTPPTPLCDLIIFVSMLLCGKMYLLFVHRIDGILSRILLYYTHTRLIVSCNIQHMYLLPCIVLLYATTYKSKVVMYVLHYLIYLHFFLLKNEEK